MSLGVNSEHESFSVSEANDRLGIWGILDLILFNSRRFYIPTVGLVDFLRAHDELDVRVSDIRLVSFFRLADGKGLAGSLSNATSCRWSAFRWSIKSM
jgi:hypothetical protein